MKEKIIGIDITSAITQGGGIGRYTRELVRAVVALDKGNGYQLFSAKRPSATFIADSIPTGEHVQYKPAPLDERWLYRIWYRLRLPLPVQWFTGQLDLFHSPDFVLPPVGGGIPTLLTVHDLSFAHYPDVFPKTLVDYLNRVVPWSVARATHILADSQATKHDLISLWQVPKEKVTVLYSGVDARFRPVADDKHIKVVRRTYELGTRPYILAVGTVQPRKNYQMLIQAFKPVAATWPGNLVIAGGKGWLYDEMLAEIERQGLNGRVRFIGFVDDDDLPALYSGATLLAQASLYEGFGLPLLEAMACGVPVIAADVSSLPEVTGRGGETAVLLSPHDAAAWSEAMTALVADPMRRSRMVVAGFRQARQFSWQKAARQLLGVYEEMLQV